MTTVWEIVWDEEKAKVRGKALAESANWRNVQIAREIALELGSRDEFVTADDVRRELANRFPDIEPGNWLGSVWERKHWHAVGYTQSSTPGRHRNMIRLWKLRSVRHATEGEPC